MECPLLHLLQRTHLSCLLLSREINLSIPALPNLRDDVELVHSELSPTSAQQYPLSATVRLELFRVFGGFQVSLCGVFVEFGSTFLTSGEVSESLEVIIEEIYKVHYEHLRPTPSFYSAERHHNSHSCATVALRFTSELSRSSLSHN